MLFWVPFWLCGFLRIWMRNIWHTRQAVVYIPRTAGIKQRQLVSMAPFTTSSSGSTTKTRRARPTTCIDSNTHTTRKSEKEERRHDLNTQIREERNSVPKIKIKTSSWIKYEMLPTSKNHNKNTGSLLIFQGQISKYFNAADSPWLVTSFLHCGMRENRTSFPAIRYRYCMSNE